jgi:hypothetical protein
MQDSVSASVDGLMKGANQSSLVRAVGTKWDVVLSHDGVPIVSVVGVDQMQRGVGNVGSEGRRWLVEGLEFCDGD